MRNVPAGLDINQMPGGFDPPLSDNGQVIKWEGSIDGARYAIGLRPSRMATDLAEARKNLRKGVWQLMEFSRLGRQDLMLYAAVDRHSDRRRPSLQR